MVFLYADAGVPQRRVERGKRPEPEQKVPPRWSLSAAATVRGVRLLVMAYNSTVAVTSRWSEGGGYRSSGMWTL